MPRLISYRHVSWPITAAAWQLTIRRHIPEFRDTSDDTPHRQKKNPVVYIHSSNSHALRILRIVPSDSCIPSAPANSCRSYSDLAHILLFTNLIYVVLYHTQRSSLTDKHQSLPNFVMIVTSIDFLSTQRRHLMVPLLARAAMQLAKTRSPCHRAQLKDQHNNIIQ